MITKGCTPFDILNYSNGKKVRTQVDASDEEVIALIEKHKDDPLWDIRFKKYYKFGHFK